MVKFSTPRVDVTGPAKPERVYVPIQVGTAVLSSSERLTIRVPGEQPTVIEVRESNAGTFQVGEQTVRS